MRIICSKDRLMENINIVSKAVTQRTTLPILECILLTADDNGLKLMANDLEMGIETAYIPATVVEKGVIALEARMFSEIIRRLPDGEDVSLYSNENNITMINCKKTEFKILGQYGDEFPKIPKVEKSDEYKIKSSVLRSMIRETIFAVSLDESKPVLTGELFEIENGILNMVAVDGFRVAYRISPFEEKCPDKTAVIPSKTLNDISKIIPADEEAIISLYFTDKHVLFETKECTVVSRLLEGEFLKYRQIFTDDHTTSVKIHRQQFIMSLERASLISKDIKKNPVKLQVEGDVLIITSNTEMGTSYDEIATVTEGSNLEIAFNPRYLIDALKAIDDEYINIKFTTSLSPCTIVGQEPHNYKYLILPLRLKS